MADAKSRYQIAVGNPFRRAAATGLAFVPMMGAVLPANLIAARITEHIGAPATIALGAVLAACGCVTLLAIQPGTPYGAIVGQFVIMGGGLGLLVPPLTSTLLGSVEKSRSGIAAGVLNATRQTGSVLGVALFGSLIGQSGQFMSGAHHSLLISAALLLIAAIVIWRGARNTWWSDSNICIAPQRPFLRMLESKDR